MNNHSGMKMKTNVEAGGLILSNHNQAVAGGLRTNTKVKAGGRLTNHNQAVAGGLRTNTKVKAGGRQLNHSQSTR